MQHTIHKYFKKVIGDVTILVQLDPESLKGMEIMAGPEGVSRRRLTFDEYIEEDLAHDGFAETGPLEFNLYLKGLAGPLKK